MNEQGSNNELVSLWEQMGASTGSFLGKIIGMYAQYGLMTYDQLVVNPLKQYAQSTEQNLQYSYQPPDIREQTWSLMGKKYGETLGTSIGTSMDLFINSLKVMTPPVGTESASTTDSYTSNTTQPQ